MNLPACIISAVSIPFLYCSKLAAIKYKEKLKGYPIPAELFLVIITTMICYFLPEDNEVIVVGHVPSGLPTPAVPPVGKYLSDFMSGKNFERKPTLTLTLRCNFDRSHRVFNEPLACKNLLLSPWLHLVS